MRLLLDTNVLIWFAADPKKIGPKTQKILEDAEEIYISAVSVLEITIKVINKKLSFPSNLDDIVKALNGKYLDMNAEHAQALNRFPKLAKHDPFDRLLLAQAHAEQLDLLTADEMLLSLKEGKTLDARN